MPTLRFVQTDVSVPLEERTAFESEIVPRVGDEVVIPGNLHDGLFYKVQRVLMEWTYGHSIPVVNVYIGDEQTYQ